MAAARALARRSHCSASCGLPSRCAIVRQIALIAVEQAIEAHRRVVMRCSRKRAEAIAGIEAGLAHGAVAFVEVAAQPVAAEPGAHAHHARIARRNSSASAAPLRLHRDARSLSRETLCRLALGCSTSERIRRGSRCWRRPSPALGRSHSRNSAPVRFVPARCSGRVHVE